MLNKKVCLHCFKQSFRYADGMFFKAGKGKGFVTMLSRDEYFDDKWDKDFDCPCTVSEGLVFIISDPPDTCPYLLEQALAKPSDFKVFVVKYKLAFSRNPWILGVMTSLFILSTILTLFSFYRVI